MGNIVIVRLKSAGSRTGPFDIKDMWGNVLQTNVSKQSLISGITVELDVSIDYVIIVSTGKCKFEKYIPIKEMTKYELAALNYKEKNTSTLWRHLTNPVIYNTYYGNIEPYIIEYPFAYQYYDEILQNVKDYTKVYEYLPIVDGVFNDNSKIQTNNKYFNKAILYNDQQSSGVLELVPKPINNLSSYMKYPLYNAESKTITFTKSDNFYQYNTFWSLVKNKSLPLFITSCESLSIDKIVNQPNMDYGKRSFKKEPLRAKDLKVRHILDNASNVHLVSQFIIAPSQISYK